MFVFFIACKKEDTSSSGQYSGTAVESYSSNVANRWYGLFLELTKETPGFSPPVAARAFGYVGLSLFESVAPGSKKTKTLSSRLSRFEIGVKPGGGKEYFWPASANAALAEIGRNIYRNKSTNLLKIDSLENAIRSEFASQASQESIENGISFGKSVGKSVYDYSKTDGQDECFLTNFPVGYQFALGLGKWVPTPPNYNPIPMQPYWGGVRTFMYNNSNIFMPNIIPGFSVDSNSSFYKQALETYYASSELTEGHKIIADYWSDDPGKTSTPSGHSISILKQIIEKENLNLEKGAIAYAKMGFAVHDAFVNCWKCKFQENLIRPVTYIRTYIDPSFDSYLTTPPFPEFPSGHSVQSGAAQVILEDIFGKNYVFLDNTNSERTDIDGTPRSYQSFADFANEAAISRLYGGIHFTRAITQGVYFGNNIGKNVSSFSMEVQ